jgi:hypothetical protein
VVQGKYDYIIGAMGVGFIPVAGWGISLGLTIVDMMCGDYLYNALDKKK